MDELKNHLRELAGTRPGMEFHVGESRHGRTVEFRFVLLYRTPRGDRQTIGSCKSEIDCIDLNDLARQRIEQQFIHRLPEAMERYDREVANLPEPLRWLPTGSDGFTFREFPNRPRPSNPGAVLLARKPDNDNFA